MTIKELQDLNEEYKKRGFVPTLDLVLADLKTNYEEEMSDAEKLGAYQDSETGEIVC